MEQFHYLHCQLSVKTFFILYIKKEKTFLTKGED